MSRTMNDPLQNIAKGTTVVVIGVVASLALNFVLRIALIRYLTQDEYGIYALAVMLVGIISAMAMLGLDEGSARHIAFFTGRSEQDRIGSVVSASIKITLASSLVIAVLTFVFADAIATMAFHSHALTGALQVIAAAIPLTALLQILTSIMRGLNEPWARAFFRDTLRPLLFLALLAGVIMLNLPFASIIYAYVLSLALTLVVFAVYALRRPRRTALPGRDLNVARDLIFFSLPLLSVNMLMLLMSQTTALLLGYFTDPAEVGKYDLAITMASLLLIVINSLGYIYTPTASNLYGKGRLEELRQSYVASTKWAYILTVPVLFVLLLFPTPLVQLMFGEQYVSIVLVLQIIAVGYMVNPVTGPNYHTLIAAGKMRMIIVSFLLNATSNILLCLVLIPPYGIAGAAVAAGLSSAAGNLLLSIGLYHQLGIHPITKSFLSSIAASIVLLSGFAILLNYSQLQPSILLAVFCLAIYTAVYAGSLLLLRAVDKEDIMILAAIEKKIGIKITPTIARFVH